MIEVGEIQMLSDEKLTRQTIQQVLNTNKGEWYFNKNEGITFDNLLGKNIEEEIVKSEVTDGVSQVDSTLVIKEFETKTDTENRQLTVNFTAKSENDNTTVQVSTTWE